MSNGDLFTMSKMNSLLSLFLNHYFPPGFGKFLCHSFRAGLPSMMAANPNLFSKEETMEVGRWSSDAYLRYTRLHGIRSKSIFNKINEECLVTHMSNIWFFFLAAILSKDLLAKAIKEANASLMDEAMHTPGDSRFNAQVAGF